MTIYVDLDGVLADFDKEANEILGTDNHHKFTFIWGNDVTWDRLHAKEDFFKSLPKMPDAMELWKALKPFNPVILTALPHSDPERVDRQKREWVAKNFFPNPEVITCKTADKPNFYKPGDILIDDRAVNRDAWQKAGGTYIIHTSAANTLTTLRALGVIK